jgi:hypothetical protein
MPSEDAPEVIDLPELSRADGWEEDWQEKKAKLNLGFWFTTSMY